MSAPEARIGIVGAGFWASTFYLPFLAEQPDARCVGVVGLDRPLFDAMRDEYGLEVASTDVEELLAAGCDGVIVASPNHLHRAHAEAALAAGAHVLVEKPMTVALVDARALAASADAAGRRLSLAHGWNYSPLAAWAQELLARGTLGTVRHVHAHMASSLDKLFAGAGGYGVAEVGGVSVEASPETWARRASGGGYLYGQLSHELGLALALVPAEPREVHARMSLGPTGVDLDVALTVAFDDGVIGSFSGHGRLPAGARQMLTLDVVGERGTMALDFERERAEARLHEAPAPAHGRRPADLAFDARPGDGAYSCDGPTRWLIDSCRGSRPVDRAPAAAGVRAVAVMEAAWRSVEQQRPIVIEQEKTA